MGLTQAKDDLPKPQVDVSRYLGVWYEIARLPMRFERDLHCVTATYTQNEDGTVKVHNRGTKGSPQGPLEQISGKAWTVDETNSRLKVQFFWPLSADYFIMKRDDEYKWAIVGHPSRKYLWFLSRTPKIDEKLFQEMSEFAKEHGFPVEKLIRPEHLDTLPYPI